MILVSFGSCPDAHPAPRGGCASLWIARLLDFSTAWVRRVRAKDGIPVDDQGIDVTRMRTIRRVYSLTEYRTGARVLRQDSSSSTAPSSWRLARRAGTWVTEHIGDGYVGGRCERPRHDLKNLSTTGDAESSRLQELQRVRRRRTKCAAVKCSSIFRSHAPHPPFRHVAHVVR